MEVKMGDIESTFRKLGIKIPEILLPAEGTDLTRWSVVACDQYTSQPEYWDELERYIADSPSTYSLIFPEVYLESENARDRIARITKSMGEYLDKGVLVPEKPCLLYVDRKTRHAASRKGLILAVDLEEYEYRKGSQSLVRATEGTVIERLPPRIMIRENALVELPHIMLLIDDPGKTVIEPLAEKCKSMELLYDFELMKDSGHIKGYRVDDRSILKEIGKALEKLADPVAFKAKYQMGTDKSVLLFAAGDGNHSLAAAKAYWETIKDKLPAHLKDSHPARFVLVEVVNVHDDGLVFEPIHRVVFNVDLKKILDQMQEFFGSQPTVWFKEFNSEEELYRGTDSLRHESGNHVLPFISGGRYGAVIVEKPLYNLEVGTLQSFLDHMAKTDIKIKTDYVHGREITAKLGSRPGNVGFILPPMDKHDLFKTVIVDGALPRKTFSMGEADEKRFYLECRKIK
jgi:uncharacterized protein (DUF1015 family)